MTRHALTRRRAGVASLGTLLAVSTLALAGPSLASGSHTAALPGTGRAPHAQVTAPHSGARPFGQAVAQDLGSYPAPTPGTVAISDYANSRVVTVAPDGTETDVPGEWDGPGGVAYDSDGDLFVATGFGDGAVEIAPDGTQTTVPTSGLGFTGGIAVDSAGDVFLSDLYGSQVVEVTPDGTQTTLPFEGLYGNYGVAVDADGDVYVASSRNGSVFELAPDGTQTTIASDLSNPTGVAVNSQGDVLVGVGSGVVSIAPDGTRTTLPLSGINDAATLAVDADDNVLVDDYSFEFGGSTVRLAPDGTQTTISPDTGGWGVAAFGAAQPVKITSDAPVDAVPGDTYEVTATGGKSEAPVTIAASSDSTRQCVVTDNGDGTAEVDLNRVGDCTIVASQAADDTHMAGSAQQTVTIQHRQSITFTSTPQRPRVDGAYQVTANGGGSGNAVVFSLAEESDNGCSVTPDGQVTFDHATDCVVEADQAAGDGYVAAAPAYQQISIDKGLQQVTFTSVRPAPAKVGKTLTLTATGGATGNKVTFSATGACTIRRAVLTFTHAGHCYVYASEAGSADYETGKAHETIQVVKH